MTDNVDYDVEGMTISQVCVYGTKINSAVRHSII